VSNLLKELLVESSTSDGATLWLVLENRSGQASVDDLLVEIRNEMHLINMILGAGNNRAALEQYRLFVNRQGALDLATSRAGGQSQDDGMAPMDPGAEPL
jgi:hypothetical protein